MCDQTRWIPKLLWVFTGQTGHQINAPVIKTHSNPSFIYRNDPKFSDRLDWTDSADSDQTAPRGQGLHCLLFHLHLIDKIP